jgi:hypothetical protein
MARARNATRSPEALRPLYAAVMRYHAARPWDVIDDDHVFGVDDPATGTIGWCSVLGGAGTLCGLAVYDGADGLALYRAILRDEVSPDEVQTTQRGFVVAFGARNELEPAEREVLRALGIRPRGREAWPTVRTMAPGYLPALPDATGASRLITILEQVLVVAQSTTNAAEAIAPDADGRLLVRRHVRASAAWTSVRLKPADPPALIVPGVPDELRVRRVCDLPQPAGLAWECDYAYAPIPIQDARGVPGYAAVVLIVDQASGIIVQGQLGLPPLDPAFLQEAFLAAIETGRVRPSVVRVRTNATRAFLAPLAAAVGFRTERSATLAMLEEARASMVAAMTR